jgi:carboxyl-terminal processing protease
VPIRRHLRRAILPLALLGFAGCSELLTPDPETSANLADFEAAWQRVEHVYPFFQFKHINWDSIHVAFRPLAEASQGDDIDRVLFAMLQNLRDGHVRLSSPGGASVPTYIPPRLLKDRFAYSPLVVRRYFATELRLAGNDRIEYGIINGTIGYIAVSTLRNEEPVLTGFDEALASVKETKGLIIDVRHDEGGSDWNSMGIVGRLISKPIDGLPHLSSDSTLVPGGIIVPRGPFQYTRPVVLLINGVCFSACEDFAEMMKHVPTVTAVGDTTSGASGAPQPFRLPSGRTINVSTIFIRRYDGQPIEWNGVPPDVRVAQTQSDVDADRDPQLEYAIGLLETEGDDLPAGGSTQGSPAEDRH